MVRRAAFARLSISIHNFTETTRWRWSTLCPSEKKLTTQKSVCKEIGFGMAVKEK